MSCAKKAEPNRALPFFTLYRGTYRCAGWCVHIRGLSLHYEQNTNSDCEDGHEHTESGKTESQHLNQPIDDEPDTQQEDAEIFR